MKSVLEMRVRQLEEVQQKFAVQQQKVVEINRLLTETREQIRQELCAKPESDINPVMSQQRFGYVQYLKHQAEALRQRLRKQEQILEIVREEMRQAHIQKKSLELLEEKQRRAYIQHLQAQEEKELEDLVVARRRLQ